MNQKTFVGCLLIFLLLALIASVALNAVQLGVGFLSSGDAIAQPVKPKVVFSEQIEQSGADGATDRVVQIDLEGIISSAEVGNGLFEHGLPMVLTIKRALEQA